MAWRVVQSQSPPLAQGQAPPPVRQEREPIAGYEPPPENLFVRPEPEPTEPQRSGWRVAESRIETPEFDLDSFVTEESKRQGIRPELSRAIIQAESAGRADAVSPKGAQGLMQLMPGTAEELGVTDPFDPQQNVRGGISYFKQMLDRFNGNERLALAAYNSGPGAVERNGSAVPPFPETRAYVDRVLGMADGRAQQAQPGTNPWRVAPTSDEQVANWERNWTPLRAPHDPESPNESGFRRALNDTMVAAWKGTARIGEIGIGIADFVMFGGYLRQGLEDYLGYKPHLDQAYLDTYYTDKTINKGKTLQEKETLVDKAVYALQNLDMAGLVAVESLPPMIASGLAMYGTGGTALIGPLAAGAVGEGAIVLGSSTAELTGQGQGTLTAKQRGLIGTQAALTAAIGYMGGRLAKHLDIADPETLLAAAFKNPSAKRNLVAAVGLGMFQESGEEVLQGYQESMLQNVAAGRPLMEGVNDEVVLGGFAGGLTGGGTNFVTSAARIINDPDRHRGGSIEKLIRKAARERTARERVQEGVTGRPAPADPTAPAGETRIDERRAHPRQGEAVVDATPEERLALAEAERKIREGHAEILAGERVDTGEEVTTGVAEEPVGQPMPPPEQVEQLPTTYAEATEEWNTTVPDRSGTKAYTHIIRGKNDPERSPRSKRKGQETKWKEMRKWDTEKVSKSMLMHMRDGQPRTFNRIGVEMWDRTADMLLDEKPDQALWSLVSQGLVEYSPEAPIQFRITNKGLDELGVPPKARKRAAVAPPAEPTPDTVEPVTEKVKPELMTLQKYMELPESTMVPKKHLLNTVLSDYTQGTLARKFTAKQLRALAIGWGAGRISGNKAKVAEAILEAYNLRKELQGKTPSDLSKLSAKRLDALLKQASLPKIGNKAAKARQLIAWRDNAKAKAKRLVAEAKHFMAVQAAMDRGEIVDRRIVEDHPALVERFRPPQVEWINTPPHIRVAVGQMWTMLNSSEARNYKIYTETGVGSDLSVQGRVPAPPIFHELVGGDSISGRQSIKGSIATVEAGLLQFVRDHIRNEYSDLAVDLAVRKPNHSASKAPMYDDTSESTPAEDIAQVKQELSEMTDDELADIIEQQAPIYENAPYSLGKSFYELAKEEKSYREENAVTVETPTPPTDVPEGVNYDDIEQDVARSPTEVAGETFRGKPVVAMHGFKTGQPVAIKGKKKFTVTIVSGFNDAGRVVLSGIQDKKGGMVPIGGLYETSRPPSDVVAVQMSPDHQAVLDLIEKTDRERVEQPTLGAEIEQLAKDAQRSETIADDVFSLVGPAGIVSDKGVQPSVFDQVQPTQGKPLWEMTEREFAQAAARGRIHPNQGIPVPGEETAKTPLKMGELNNYSADDIAAFYVQRRGGGDQGIKIGFEEMMQDAALEGRTGPQGPSKMLVPQGTWSETTVANQMYELVPRMQGAGYHPFVIGPVAPEGSWWRLQVLDVGLTPSSIQGMTPDTTMVKQHLKEMGFRHTTKVNPLTIMASHPDGRQIQFHVGARMSLTPPINVPIIPQAKPPKLVKGPWKLQIEGGKLVIRHPDGSVLITLEPSETDRAFRLLNRANRTTGPDTTPSFMRVDSKDGKKKIAMGVHDDLKKTIATSLYAGASASTTTRELIQNAMDSLRTRQDDAGRGMVRVRLELNDQKFITAVNVADNGIGMTLAEVEKELVDLGDSGKRTQVSASGGFGMAKAAFLLGGQSVRIATTKGGKRVTFGGSPDEFLDTSPTGGVEVQEETVTGSDGTVVRFELTKPEDSYKTIEWLANTFSRSPALPGELIIDALQGDKVTNYEDLIDPMWWSNASHLQPFDNAKYTEPETFAVPGARVSMRVSNEKALSSGPRIVMANNGIFAGQGRRLQVGGYRSKEKAYPAHILVDIQATVPEGTHEYPFTANRETIRDKTQEAIDAELMQRVVLPFFEEGKAANTKLWNEHETRSLPSGRKLMMIDASGQTTLDEWMKFPQFNVLSEGILEVLETVIAKGLPANLQDKVIKRGLILAKDIAGLHIFDPEFAENQSVAAREDLESAILINPLKALAEGASHEEASGAIWHTIYHEVLHQLYADHDEKFTTGMYQLHKDVGVRTLGETMRRIDNALADAERVGGGLEELVSHLGTTRGVSTDREAHLKRIGVAVESKDSGKRPGAPDQDVPRAAGGAGGGGRPPRQGTLFGTPEPPDPSRGPRPQLGPKTSDYPNSRSIPREKIEEFNSIKKMPKKVQKDIAYFMHHHGGFQAQRRNVQGWDRMEAMARDLMIPLEKLVPGTALNDYELYGYAIAIAGAMSEYTDLQARLDTDPNFSEKDKLRMSYLADVNTVLIASMRGASAETGRALNVLRAKALALETNEIKWIRAAMRAPGFDGDLKKVAKDFAKGFGDPLRQLKLLQQRAHGKPFDILMAYYYNNLLSGIRTHFRNLFGNSFNLMFGLALPIATGPIDKLRSEYTRWYFPTTKRKTPLPRTSHIGELRHGARGVLRAITGEGERAMVFFEPKGKGYAVGPLGNDSKVQAMLDEVMGHHIGLGMAVRDMAFTFRHGFRPVEVEAASVGRYDTGRAEVPGFDQRFVSDKWNAVLGHPEQRARWAKIFPELPWAKWDDKKAEIVRDLTQMTINWPMRALDAADMAFRQMAYSQELYSQVYVEARRRGATTTQEMSELMADLMLEDSVEMNDIRNRAHEFEARNVFQDQPGPMTSWFLKAKSPDKPWPMRMAFTAVMPFVKISGAIMRHGGQYSPLGFFMYPAMRHSWSPDPGEITTALTDRQEVQAKGRAALGSLLMLPLAYIAGMGHLVGNPPDDRGESEEFYQTGKLPNSILIGDYYYRFVLFQPFSVPMAAVAQAWQETLGSDEDDITAEDVAADLVIGSGQSLLDQSYMSGLSTLMDALERGGDFVGRWASLTAQGFLVPYSGAARGLTQAIDPVVRQPDGLVESIQAITPGLSQRVPGRRTRTGEYATRPGGWIRRGLFVPAFSRKIDDLVTVELERLRIRPVAHAGEFTMDGVPLNLPDEERDQVTMAVGYTRRFNFERTVYRGDYSGMGFDAQKDLMEAARDKASRDVRANVIRAYRAGLPISLGNIMPREAFDQVDNPSGLMPSSGVVNRR